MEKVSIIIPVYNGSNYLKKAIDSALNQTYENKEIIVINDGSNDNGKTEKIAKSYGKKIRYYKKENGGVSSALNLGIKKSKGKYISWLSHDDTYLPNKIKDEISFINDIGKEDIIVFSNYEYIDENDDIIEKIEIHKRIPSVDKYFVFYKRLISGISLLIPKKKLLKLGLFDENKKYTQDYDMWYRLINCTDFYYIGKILVQIRSHLNQSSNTAKGVKQESENFWFEKINNENKIIIEKVFGSEYNFKIELYNSFKYSNYENLKKEIKKELKTKYFDELFDNYYNLRNEVSRLQSEKERYNKKNKRFVKKTIYNIISKLKNS